jgi:pimeloyl-ACP methyl ester carboxylesterase
MKHLEFAGDGETLLFLHGGNVAGWMWGMQAPAFTDHRVVVPDFPGFGASNDEPWVSIAATADDLATLLDGTPAHVVGLSLGSSVAVELAARHPHLVSSLFLASAQLAPPRRRDMMLARLLLRFWEQPAFWSNLARSYGLRGDDAQLFIDTGLGIRRETAVAIYDEVRRGVPAATLEAVRAPALVVGGEKDSPAITRASMAIAADLGWGTAIAPGMHHQWNIENVELFNRSLRAWLDRREVHESLGSRI